MSEEHSGIDDCGSPRSLSAHTHDAATSTTRPSPSSLQKVHRARLPRGDRVNPRADGRPDSRPNVRESLPLLGELTSDFNFSQRPRRPEILPLCPATTSSQAPVLRLAQRYPVTSAGVYDDHAHVGRHSHRCAITRDGHSLGRRRPGAIGGHGRFSQRDAG